jgi:hypothetical protein
MGHVVNDIRSKELNIFINRNSFDLIYRAISVHINNYLVYNSTSVYPFGFSISFSKWGLGVGIDVIFFTFSLNIYKRIKDVASRDK